MYGYFQLGVSAGVFSGSQFKQSHYIASLTGMGTNILFGENLNNKAELFLGITTGFAISYSPLMPVMLTNIISALGNVAATVIANHPILSAAAFSAIFVFNNHDALEEILCKPEFMGDILECND